MARRIKAGSTDVSVVIRIIDATDGTPETGVVYNTSGIDLQYRREGATSTAITEATLAGLDSAHSDGGFLHIGNGYYRLDLPDAAVASGASGVLIHGTVTGMVVIGEYVELVAYDPSDAVRLGLTALPNAAADAAGGLPISDAGGLDLDALNSNVSAILVDTAEIGAAGAGLTAVPWNASWDAEVQSECADALAAYDPPTNAEMVARTLASADYATAANQSVIAGYIDTEVASILAAVDTEVAAIKAVTDNLPDSGALTSLATASALATVDSNVDSILADTGTDGVVIADKTGFRLSSTGVDDILDEVVEGSYTLRQLIRGISAALLGEVSGAATTEVTIRNASDSKSVIVATVDSDGNRSAVTLDLT